MRPLAAAVALLAVGLTPSSAEERPTTGAMAHTASHVQVGPDDVKWGPCPPAVPRGASCAVVEGDLTAPGKLFAFRIKVPDGFEIAPHFHPADEHLVVLSGVFNLGFGDRFDRADSRGFPAGSFMVMPEGLHHYAWAKGETILHVYAEGPWGLTYVDPEDDPRNAR
jgi:quercetin dioxygenase-like cupin family protein